MFFIGLVVDVFPDMIIISFVIVVAATPEFSLPMAVSSTTAPAFVVTTSSTFTVVHLFVLRTFSILCRCVTHLTTIPTFSVLTVILCVNFGPAP